MRPPNHYNGDQFWRVTKLELENYVFGMLLGTFQGTRNKDLLVFSIDSYCLDAGLKDPDASPQCALFGLPD